MKDDARDPVFNLEIGGQAIGDYTIDELPVLRSELAKRLEQALAELLTLQRDLIIVEQLEAHFYRVDGGMEQ